MFWIICITIFGVGIIIGAYWGKKKFNNMLAGVLIWGIIAGSTFVVALPLVAAYGPREGASSVDYAIENVGGDMYYVDENGSHNISSRDYTTQFSDVECPTYRITAYSWENWPAFPDAELLIPKEMSTND